MNSIGDNRGPAHAFLPLVPIIFIGSFILAAAIIFVLDEIPLTVRFVIIGFVLAFDLVAAAMIIQRLKSRSATAAPNAPSSATEAVRAERADGRFGSTSSNSAKIVDESDSLRSANLRAIFAFVLGTILVAGLIVPWIAHEGRMDPGYYVYAFIATIVLVVLTALTVRRRRILAVFDAGEILAERWPLRLGEETTISYRRNVKTPVSVSRVDATLTCTEFATYTVGTSRHTASEIIHRTELPVGAGFAGPRVYEASWRIRIPTGGPPSFKAPNNQIAWKLTVNFTVDDAPNDGSDFAVPVAAERVE